MTKNKWNALITSSENGHGSSHNVFTVLKATRWEFFLMILCAEKHKSYSVGTGTSQRRDILRANSRRMCRGGSRPRWRTTSSSLAHSQRETRETRTTFTHFRCRPMLEPRRRRRADSSAQQTTTANDSSWPSSRASLLRDGTVTENDARLASVDVVRAAYSVRHRAMVVDDRRAVLQGLDNARRGIEQCETRYSVATTSLTDVLSVPL